SDLDLRNDEDRGKFSSTLRGRKVNGDRRAIAGRNFGVSDLQAVGWGHDHGLGADGPDRKRNASRRSGNKELPAGRLRIGCDVHIDGLENSPVSRLTQSRIDDA